jgi:cation:H+ antiporter
MIWTLLQFALAASIIVVAGTFLTRFADAIADLTGLGRLLIGSILLAGATSLPELSVDLSAVSIGEGNLAVGDLMGSSLFNLLILAVLDLSHTSRGRMLSRTSAAHALSGTLSISLTAFAALFIILSGRISWTVLGLGPGAWALLITYVLGVRLVFVDQRISAMESEHQQEVPIPAGRLRMAQAVGGFLTSAVVIIVFAPMLARSASGIADFTGLGGTFIGTTLVALCTSLPELVASLAALRMGAFDLAVGNVFGSNSFNMVLLPILDLAQPGSLLAVVSQTHAVTALAGIIITALAILSQLYRNEKRRISILEPDAVLIILLVVGSLWLVYHLA